MDKRFPRLHDILTAENFPKKVYMLIDLILNPRASDWPILKFFDESFDGREIYFMRWVSHNDVDAVTSKEKVI